MFIKIEFILFNAIILQIKTYILIKRNAINEIKCANNFKVISTLNQFFLEKKRYLKRKTFWFNQSTMQNGLK